VGLFISFEGGEGCGKSTQAKRLGTKLERLGYHVVRTYEPGGTPLGEELRRCLKRARDGGIIAEAELLLFAAARSQLTRTVILPALEKGSIVICDRYSDSSVAYQGSGRGLPMSSVASINQIATSGLHPDLTVLLDMDPAIALLRKRHNRDRFEHESVAFHERVRSAYLELAGADTARWLVLDASKSPSTTFACIWSRVSPLLNEHPTLKHPAL
jgi:dTMP kinase